MLIVDVVKVDVVAWGGPCVVVLPLKIAKVVVIVVVGVVVDVESVVSVSVLQ